MAFLKTLKVMILHFNQRSTLYNEISGPELSLRNQHFLSSARMPTKIPAALVLEKRFEA
jgi:hypothetical protein